MRFTIGSHNKTSCTPSLELLEDRIVPTTYSSVDVPRSIPDQSTVTSALSIPDTFIIDDVNVTLDVTHTRDKDLDVFLIGPSGTRVQLFTDVGGNGDHFSGTTLDDEASAAITSGSAPFSGSFRPEGSLSDFDGQSVNGAWTLEITDDQKHVAGTLNSWSLTIETSQPAFSIDDVQLVEGDSGPTNFVFTVTRAGDTSGIATVDFATADGTAIAGAAPGQGDYDTATGQLTFNNGDASKTIAVTVNGDATSEAAENFFVNLSNPAGAVIVDASGQATILDDDAVSVPPPSGLVSWWTANNTAADLTGQNDANLVSGTSYAPGQVGQAFFFDGVDDRVQLPDSDSLKLTESLTVEGWVRVDSLPSNTHAQILFRGDDRGGLDPYQLSVEPNGNLRFHIESLADAVNLEAPIPLGQLVHVAGTLDHATDTMSIYIDGALAAETLTAVRPFADLDPAQNPSIGIGNHGGYPTSPHEQPFHGLIDELALYKRALTADEVQGIHDAYSKGKIEMAVLATNPDFGEVVTTQPITFVVDFISPYLPGSLDAADLQVNGIAADSVTPTDSDTATFTFGSSPVSSEGVQSMHMAAGAVTRASDGLALASFDSTFFYDLLPMEVIGTTPSPNGDLVIDGFDSPTTAVASMAAMYGWNGGWPVLYGSNAVSTNGLQFAIDEDTLLDSERSHREEHVGFIAFDENPSGDVGPYLRTGTVSGVSNVWSTVTLDRTYASMVVVATPNYDEASPPLVVRVQNAGGDSFDVMVERVDGLTDPVTSVDVHYVVVEEGVYTTATHGVNMEAVKFNSTTTDHAGDNDDFWVAEDQAANISNTYASPVVVGQVMTANDPDFSVFWARGIHRYVPPSSSAIRVGKHVGEDPNTTRADETIGYIVIDAGPGTIGGTEYIAGLGDNIVLGMDDAPPFIYRLNSTSLQLDFNEPYDPSSVGVTDLIVSSGAVTSAEAVDADSVVYTLIGVQPNVTLTVNMNAGVLTDQFGNPMLPFSATYNAPVPVLSINDVSITEGNSGEQTTATFTVSRSGDTSSMITVDYSTADDTALAGSDYIGIGTTVLTFNPGETSKAIDVTIFGDSNDEGDESFFVNLSNPTGGAIISDNQGVGVIINDDAPGSANDMYIWDIDYETRRRGNKTDVRILVTVRNDSNADGSASAGDALVSGANVSVNVTGGKNATVSGTTNGSGLFQSGWITKVPDGSYTAEVDTLTHSTFVWTAGALDPNNDDTDTNSNDKPEQHFIIGSALVAESVGQSFDAPSLTHAQLQTLINEAINRFAATGVDEYELNTIDIHIADLQGATLGLAAGNTIWLDSNAAGWGWFVDSTPWDDSEFKLAGNQGEQDRMDLLTVIMHEMGHLLGHEHEEEGVMQETLAAGERHLLEEPTFEFAFIPDSADTTVYDEQLGMIDALFARSEVEDIEG